MDPSDSSAAPRPAPSALAAHVLLPALASLAMIGLAFTPVMLFGCLARGWIAFGLAVASLGIAAFATAQAFRTRASDLAKSRLWVLTALLLLMPALLLLGPLG